MSEAKRRLLAARAMSDLASAQCAVVVDLADRLHLFRELQRSGASTAEDLARACGIPARQAASLLIALASSGYVDFDEATRGYSLSPEQSALFANDRDPLFLGGAFELAAGLASGDAERIAEGISRSSRARFPDVVSRRLGARLQNGARVVDIGCGDGAALIEIARRYPRVHGTGIDASNAALDRARRTAREQELHDRVEFVAGGAELLAAKPCDIILSLEALHEFPDPVEIARATYQALDPGGVWLLIEPCSEGLPGGNDVRFLASLAALYCLPASGFAKGALGTLSNQQAYERVLTDGGFRQWTLASEGPLHVVIEATR